MIGQSILTTIDSLPTYLGGKWGLSLGFVVLAFLLYSFTLGHDFAQDDAIVITENVYTQKGISGIPEIFGKESFAGFFTEKDNSNLVSGGRYRPLTIGLFAVVYEFFGETPWVYHFLAVLVYGLVCMLLFSVVWQLADYAGFTHAFALAFLTALLFTVHPIHTEVVANVKGLDESFSLLLGLLALGAGAKYMRGSGIVMCMLSGVALLLALLAKESALPYVVIIPLVMYAILDVDKRKLGLLTATLCIALVGYMAIRINVIGGLNIGHVPNELMNNPFIKVLEDGSYVAFTTVEKWATIIWGIGKYLQLLFLPFPLTHDYYPRHVGVMDFADLSVWMAMLMILALAVMCVVGLRRRSLLSLLLIVFGGQMLLVSNIIFPIGTHLSERFLFSPSVPFCIAIGYIVLRVLAHFPSRALMVAPYCIAIPAFAYLTVARSLVWKNDFTLFQHDVHISQNSAKVRNAAGGSLIDKAMKTKDEEQKATMLATATTHLHRAIEIHPRYKSAHLLLGNAYYLSQEYDLAIQYYRQTLDIAPESQDAEQNLFLSLREGARWEGSQNNNIEKAIVMLKEAANLRPQDEETQSLLGIAYGNKGEHQQALTYFKKAVEISPNNAQAHANLSKAWMNVGNEEEAQISFQRAARIDPNAVN